jgi:hypothetical protein
LAGTRYCNSLSTKNNTNFKTAGIFGRRLYVVGSPLPGTTSGKLLSLIRHLSRDPAALDPLQRAGAIPKLVGLSLPGVRLV